MHEQIIKHIGSDENINKFLEPNIINKNEQFILDTLKYCIKFNYILAFDKIIELKKLNSLKYDEIILSYLIEKNIQTINMEIPIRNEKMIYKAIEFENYYYLNKFFIKFELSDEIINKIIDFKNINVILMLLSYRKISTKDFYLSEFMKQNPHFSWIIKDEIEEIINTRNVDLLKNISPYDFKNLNLNNMKIDNPTEEDLNFIKEYISIGINLYNKKFIIEKYTSFTELHKHKIIRDLFIDLL